MPVIAWSTSDPDAGQVVKSDIYFGRTSNPPLAGIDFTFPFTLAFDPLLPNTQYFWKITTKDGHGGQTPGPIWSFRTGSATTSQPPTAPSNPYPPDGGVVNAEYVDLQWTATDPENNPLTYAIWDRLCYCTGNSTYAGVSTSPTFRKGPLVPGRTYYWSVNAYDGFTGSSGPVWSFTVATPVPVLFTHFNASAVGSEARIEWELQSDETMKSYTLLRRRADATGFVSVVAADVTQATGWYLDRTAEPGRKYEYQLLIHTTDGDEFRSQLATITMPAAELTLGACHPNPFNPQTTIPYTVPAGGAPVRVRLAIYDTAGRRVRVLVDEPQSPGAHDVVWKGDDASGHVVGSGIYFSVLQAGKERRTQKLVLLK
jgi:hypothetical protein